VTATTGSRTRPRDIAIAPILMAAVPGLLALGLLLAFGRDIIAPIVAWDVFAATYIVWTWVTLRGMDGSATKQHAARDDPTRATADLFLLFAPAASLVAVVILIVRASNAHGASQALLAALALVSVGVSWCVVHTVYMLRYATIYHQDGSGVEFNQEQPPKYTDFAYLAFTIGMTYQVSDTAITSPAIRGNALRHALLSYVYGTFIIAATINLIAGLNK
jgi:uncharacterized membrane protein